MKSVDFRLLPPETQSMFERHLAWHYYRESQNQQGVPFWQENLEAGEQGFPPGMGEQQPQGQPEQPPPAPPMDAFGPDPMALAPEMGEAPGGVSIAPGMGGSPELNNAVGTRGPGVADFETGFDLQ